MAYTFTEKKRIRKSFSTRSAADQVPDLLDIQKVSYKKLLQAEIEPLQRIDEGLQAAFKSVFPIESYNGAASLDFVSYTLGTPVFDVRECQQRGMVYSAPLFATLRRRKTRGVVIGSSLNCWGESTSPIIGPSTR